ncbi:MAG: energy-coupling factor transporter ATPase [Clostridia bacterium]|nr:energy-coupling factor transporter ATPase [Clostridia bacterium]
MEPAVKCTDVRFAYEEAEVITGLDMTVEKGEYIAIVGRNGSGKSTIARHMNALLVPTKGSVVVFGMDTKTESNVLPIRSRASMVFQNPDNQIVASVVEEDVAFGPENLGVPTAELRRRVDDALAIVDMAEFALRAPHELSGGQKQRVAIAGVLAMQPDMVIFDEPTSMLDPEGRASVLAAMDTLHERGITVLHITHAMEEALRADRMIVISDGKAVMSGNPETLFAEKGEELIALGLDLPPLMQLSHALKALGIDGSAGISVEEMVEKLCR